MGFRPSTLAGASRSDGGGFGKELIQSPDEKTGPRLEVRALGEHGFQLAGRDEPSFELFLFTDLDRSLDRDHLDHAYVYRSYGVGVIVYDPEALDLVLPSYGQLLLDLAARAGVEGVRARGRIARTRVEILRVDVTSDTDGVLVVESRFTSSREPTEQEHASVALDDRIGDHLLPIRIALRASALDEETFAEHGRFERGGRDRGPCLPAFEFRRRRHPIERDEAMRVEVRKQGVPWNDENELHGR